MRDGLNVVKYFSNCFVQFHERNLCKFFWTTKSRRRKGYSHVRKSALQNRFRQSNQSSVESFTLLLPVDAAPVSLAIPWLVNSMVMVQWPLAVPESLWPPAD